MLEILIVEDDAEKLRQVMTCLLDVPGVDRNSVQNARDVNEAKRLIRHKRYDLLILDIAIPEQPDELPTHNAGIALLNELLERDIYLVPRHILGLTAHQDALDAAAPRFAEDVLQVIRYDITSNEWADRLRRMARRIIITEDTSVAVPDYGVHLCVVTALAVPELDAILDLPWEWGVFDVPADPTVYHKGWFETGGKKYDVVAAAAPRMGMTASAVLAAKMAMTFRPRYLVMAGILAGIKGACELGDILVADPGWDYESGKRTVSDGRPTFAAAPHQISLNPFIRAKLALTAQDHSALDEIRRRWSGPPKQTVLTMRLGPVASGAAVLEDAAVVESIRRQHRKTLGIEMETYGVLVAADECPVPQPKAISIKSVCDFADIRKNDEHQKYAAYTSASAVRLLAERYL